MKDKRNDLLVIIPAFNEEENICQVVTNLIEKYPQYDYVIINDGSMDRTSEIAHSLGYEIIDLPINLGLAGAFQTGMRYADRKKYKYAIQLDADGQHLPEYIAPMLEKIQEGYDLVIGSRFVTEKKPKTLRMLGSNLISLAIYLTTGRKISDPTSGMRLFNQEMIREFAAEYQLWAGTGYGIFPCKAGSESGRSAGTHGRTDAGTELSELVPLHHVYGKNAAVNSCDTELQEKNSDRKQYGGG